MSNRCTAALALGSAMPSWDRLALASGLPRLEARVLLEHASGRRREWLLAHGDEIADARATEAFSALARRRRDGEPLAYLTGSREFLGRDFEVSPAVLIPRPETELLVNAVLDHASPGARVLDLGTGSGVVAISLVCERADLQVVATDRSPEALAVARRNAQHLAGQALASARLQWRAGSWWDALDAQDRFDLIASNPPYIEAGDPHLAQGDLRYEPQQALVSGVGGLDALREIVAGAPRHLRPAGWLLLEHGCDQDGALRALLAGTGFESIRTLRDASGLPRVTLGRQPE